MERVSECRMSGGCATDSEAEEDYVNRVTPERRPVVNLRGGIKRDQLQSGVDFEIEDLENFHNQELPLEEPDDEYLSVCFVINSGGTRDSVTLHAFLNELLETRINVKIVSKSE